MYEIGFSDDPVVIQSGNVIDEASYDVKRISFMPNINGSMAHYFSLKKTFGGMSTFCKVQFITISAFRLMMQKHNYHEVIALEGQNFYSTRKGFHLPIRYDIGLWIPLMRSFVKTFAYFTI